MRYGFMQECLLTFDKKGYDPFIDYLKGVAIIFVILTHLISDTLHSYTLFCLWGDMAVPLFLLVQVFHSYKKENVVLKFKQILKRIVVPFLATQVVICALLVILNRGFDIALFKGFGNLGPGAYYPYIYIQFALLIWLVAPLFRRVKSRTALLVIFIAISEVIELICIYMKIDSDIYRFLFFRYTFLLFLGFLLAKDKLIINRWALIVSLISLLFVLSFDGIIGGGQLFV